MHRAVPAQIQLRHERTEERRKLFKIAEKRHNVADTPLSRWRKILPALPQVVRAEMSRNAEVDAPIAIGNPRDTAEGKLPTDVEQDSSRHDRNDEAKNGGESALTLNDTASGRRYERT